MNGISVIICCYNSQSRIVDTLKYLVNQQDISFPWEIIIVDNACKDNTVAVAQEYMSQHASIDYSIISEPTPGLSHARHRGVSYSKYAYVLFCDDDNWLSENYLSNVYGDFQTLPDVYIIGGKGIARFEQICPTWFDMYQTNFACGEIEESDADQTIVYANEVYGAGMAVRKEFFSLLTKIGFTSILSDRTGNDLISGGDTEFCFVARMMGLQLVYDKRLTFMHFMPENRMNVAYLRKLHKGFGKSRVYTNAYSYVQSHTQMPNSTLKVPFWKDKLVYRNRELLSFYPKIWFISESEKYLPFILKYEALKGEIEEIKKLKENYIELHSKIFDLKKRINENICQHISR
jgi:glycosyltransferase involved in cell wall biosynthesis